jgi:soluble lytic murein transglycosylase
LRLATAVLISLVLTPFAAEASPRRLGQAFFALEIGNHELAYRIASKLQAQKFVNPDYVHYVAGQSAFALGQLDAALERFEILRGMRDSRFQRWAAWRAADIQFQLGRIKAAREAYWDLVNQAGNRPDEDVGLARFRIAMADKEKGEKDKAIPEFVRFLTLHPRHPMEDPALAELRALLPDSSDVLSVENRLDRAELLSAEKHWHEAIVELNQLPDTLDKDQAVRRDFVLGMTLYRMRRHYERSAELLLGVYREKGARAAEALFHGTRALSRADKDKEAIAGYQQVVKEFPKSEWAAEASFLIGWLQFNLGNFKESLPLLQASRKQFPRSSFALDALWYEGMALFLLGQYAEALPIFTTLSGKRGDLIPDKGSYWKARTLFLLGKKEDANAEYQKLVGEYPLGWYALLAQARLREQKIAVKPFGQKPRDPKQAPALPGKFPRKMARDPLLRSVDELITADMFDEAAAELRRGESSFLKRQPRQAALAALFERYRRVKDYNRPWMLALVQGGDRALDAPPQGNARIWWQYAYPLAYRPLIEKWRDLGKSPKYYLYAIMHKESGFHPATHSYADARGLLQMIPPTTLRVADALGIEYTDDMLFDPEQNIRTGSWYIGRLLEKFKGQIPLGSGAFNAGPRPIMRWLEQYKNRPIDEFVELVPYTQTRNYMRRVTSLYARYLYLYEQDLYEQPLTVDPQYLVNELTY